MFQNGQTHFKNIAAFAGLILRVNFSQFYDYIFWR